MDHGLAGFAAESMGKLIYVGDHVVHAIAIKRVTLGHYRRAGGFGAIGSAPDVGEGEEEGLLLGEAVAGGAFQSLTIRL